jgi:Glutamate-cysteine ligase family 2(GCS2)
MNTSGQDCFRFGLETEFLLVDANSFRPLWHPDLQFETLNATLEAIPAADFQCDSFKVEPPHRKPGPYVVEGYHLPDPQMNPIDLLPKGVEIRTPIRSSIEECLAALKVLHDRLQSALASVGFQAVALSAHPTEIHFSGPQNKRRHDYWQWAMVAMLTYGPDINISLPKALTRQIDAKDLNEKVNYYVPALTALTLSSPLRGGKLWRIRGRIGKSVRTYRRSVVAPALEIHLDEGGRLELKPFEMTCSLVDYRNYFLLWLTLLLDEGLKGRASDETRIYDLGRIACDGLDAETVRDRASAVLDRAPKSLGPWGFDCASLDSFRLRLEQRYLPADDIVSIFERENSISGTLRHLSNLV